VTGLLGTNDVRDSNLPDGLALWTLSVRISARILAILQNCVYYSGIRIFSDLPHGIRNLLNFFFFLVAPTLGSVPPLRSSFSVS
jgi:hypothetical protein